MLLCISVVVQDGVVRTKIDRLIHIWGCVCWDLGLHIETLNMPMVVEMHSIECLLVSSQEPTQCTSNTNIKCSQIECCSNIETARYG